MQLLGVRQYFTSSFKFNFRRRLRCDEAFKKANMLSRDDRKMNLAATVLSSSAKNRPDFRHLSAMAPAQIVSSSLNLPFRPHPKTKSARF